MNLLQKRVFLKEPPTIIGFTMVEFDSQPFKLFLSNGYNIAIVPHERNNGGFWGKPYYMNLSLEKLLGAVLIDFHTKTYSTKKYYTNVYIFVTNKSITEIEYNLFSETDYYSKNDIVCNIAKSEVKSLHSYEIKGVIS